MADRSTIPPKNKKKPILEGRTTLDNLHQMQMTSLKDQQANLSYIQKELHELVAKSEMCEDIIEKNHIDEKISSLKEQIKNWNDKKPIYDYFFETGDLLFKYYELQDKILKGDSSGTTNTVKAKPGSVLAMLNTNSNISEQPISKKSIEKAESSWLSRPGVKEGREELLEKYLQKVDPEHAKLVAAKSDESNGICDVCESEMVFSSNEAIFSCPACGFQEFILIDSDKPSYKDPPREVTYFAYKRINHFNEWLAQFQAKESTEIPEDVFQQIVEELQKERISDPSQIKHAKILEILKKLKCTNYYKHVPYILNRINGKHAPIMSREIEEKLRFMFKEIQSPFIKHCPKNRSNFLSYSYVLYKFCELLELDDYLKCFPLLKNRDKLYNQDKIWQAICQDLRWEYIRSI